MNIITIQENIGIPKYKQIVSSVERAIASNKVEKGSKMPSINKICLGFSLSRDTVLMAYDELKKRGILFAIPGKGYYVKSLEVNIKQKVFMLFDELNSFKEDIYNSFIESVGSGVQVDIYFHHFNIVMFKKLIDDSNGNYTQYVIMPTNLKEAATIIKALPEKEVFILDQTNIDLMGYPAIYQNFVKDIYDALVIGKHLLSKYQKAIIIFPGFREPIGMKEGFLNFCSEFNLPHEVIAAFNKREINAGELYIIPNDRDLVQVIEKSKTQGLLLGRDYGIISYNDTPLKKVVENGITTISTDFQAMGKILAQMIVKGKKEQIENKSALIVRNSF